MKKNFYKIKKYSKGYTIIETMIAVSLFIVVTLVGMTSLLNANLVHKKTQNMRSVIDSLNFILDDMSKNMRIGTTFHCYTTGDAINTSNTNTQKSCSSGWGIAFEPSLGNRSVNTDQWVYYIGPDNKIYKSTDGSGSFIQLTPDEVVIDTSASSFSVLGAENSASGDKQQPLIGIRLVGKITYKNIDTPFSIQTSVSQRLIDVGTSSSVPVTYRYVKFNVTTTKTEPTSGCTQISEFALLSNGSAVSWPGGTTASNPGGSAGGGGSENASNTIDGSLSNKLCDLNATGNNPMSLVIDTGSSVTFNGYKYGTANDAEDRDPISWTVSGSNDNSNWTVIDTRSNETITSSRNTYTSNYSF